MNDRRVEPDQAFRMLESDLVAAPRSHPIRRLKTTSHDKRLWPQIAGNVDSFQPTPELTPRFTRRFAKLLSFSEFHHAECGLHYFGADTLMSHEEESYGNPPCVVTDAGR